MSRLSCGGIDTRQVHIAPAVCRLLALLIGEDWQPTHGARALILCPCSPVLELGPEAQFLYVLRKRCKARSLFGSSCSAVLGSLGREPQRELVPRGWRQQPAVLHQLVQVVFRAQPEFERLLCTPKARV